MDTTYSLKLPPKNYRRIIEELSVTIPDPVLKLKFLKQAINEYQKISSQGNLKPPIAGVAFQKKLLDNAEELWPGSKNAAKNLIRKDVITAPDIKSKWVYKLRYVIGSAILMFFILGVGTALSPLVRSFNLGARISPNTQQAKPPNTKNIIRKPIRYSQPSNGGENPPSSIVKSVNSQNEAQPVLKQLRNPILLALTTSQQTKNSQTDPSTREPLLSSPAPKSENHSPSSIAKPAKSQNGPGLVLKYFQNPILMALNSQKAINTKAGHISQKPVSFSQPHVGGNLKPLTANSNPAIQLIELQTPLTYFQSPLLMALASLHTQNAKPMHISQMPPSSYQPRESENLPTLPASIKPAAQLIELQTPLTYFQSPMLIALTSQPFISSKLNRIPQRPILSSRPPEGQKHSSTPAVKIINYQIEPEQVPEYLQHPIWLVEKTSDREIYSNRLQIITTHTISNLPREYYRFPKNSNLLPVNSKIADKISGIVYHASESDLYPFMPEMNHSILKYSKQLIKYLLRKKSYNFFIDRFGRVYRLVREDHAAFHAGNSIWADEEEIYLNLNHAFIGICFEGKDFEEIKINRQQTNSNPARLKPTGISSFNEAQLRSGKELTDWLRIKYNIPQHNCVPHALISVNPDKMLIGFHLDLARGFPFARFGLSDKYQEPLPSIVEFGFVYDNYFAKIFNGELWRGIRYSEEILERQAGNAGMSFAEYRKSLQRKFYRYREWNEEMLEKKDQLIIKPQ
jgi:hypothetical protein